MQLLACRQRSTFSGLLRGGGQKYPWPRQGGIELGQIENEKLTQTPSKSNSCLQHTILIFSGPAVHKLENLKNPPVVPAIVQIDLHCNLDGKTLPYKYITIT